MGELGERRPRHATRLIGHERVVDRLSALASATAVPPTLLLAGPAGIGKGRLAGWWAARLLCKDECDPPCGRCRSCRHVARLTHPDLHWFAPHERPDSGSNAGQIEDVRAARAERLARLRDDALAPAPAPGRRYYVATVRALRQAARMRPAEGERQLFVLTHADRLGSSGGEAANALLKLLEEPPPGTHFALTTHRPDELPLTVRSRSAVVRVPPLDTAQVERVLEAGFVGEPPDGWREAARLAEGSVGRALDRLRPEGRQRRQRALGLLSATLAGDRTARYDAVDAEGFSGARGAFTAVVDEMEALIIEGGRWAARREGAENVGPVGEDVAKRLVARPTDAMPPAGAWHRALEAVARAAERARRNVSPTLALHELLVGLERALGPRPSPDQRS